jgi:mono/diheme cytochrome c family protein
MEEPVVRVFVRRGRLSPLLLALLGAGVVVGCSDDSSSSGAAPPPTAASAAPAGAESSGTSTAALVESRSQEDLIAAGRSVYNANCIACHAMDPTKDGALGPAVAGSSLELLEARVVHGGYPEGYEPKRPSRVMVALPHLEPRLPELAAYLQSL